MADERPCGNAHVHGRHSWEEGEPAAKWNVCRGVEAAVLDDRSPVLADVTGMTFPYLCTRCNHPHDASQLTGWHRYLDCTAWRCPACGSLIDDRPVAWGGSAIPLDQEGRERR
ncbi:hypothetical protein [Microbacterium sp. NPDC078849]|uniref:hypothetical protein n=1 Tax=unclassified Microbacterium TaxID=2609290 RepID=UPI00344CD8AE